MTEAALARKDHRDAGVVAAVDDIPVADRAAGLNDRGDTLADTDLGAVAEREERVRNHRAAGKAALFGLCLLHDFGLLFSAVLFAENKTKIVIGLLILLPRDPVRVFRVSLVARDFGDADAILLAGTDADGRAVFHVKHGI